MSGNKPEQTRRLIEDAVRKMPRQGRSLASYERMIAATRALLMERGDDDFTLIDVSERGGVAIGSIYLRFDSKDRLLQAVIGQELVDIVAEEDAMVAGLTERCDTLAAFLEGYIAEFSAFLDRRARILGMIMQKAAQDDTISGPGREIARHSAAITIAGILRYRDEICAADPELKARVVYQTVFAALARQFGLGTTAESADAEVWSVIRGELARMMLAYLRDPG